MYVATGEEKRNRIGAASGDGTEPRHSVPSKSEKGCQELKASTDRIAATMIPERIRLLEEKAEALFFPV